MTENDAQPGIVRKRPDPDSWSATRARRPAPSLGRSQRRAMTFAVLAGLGTLLLLLTLDGLWSGRAMLGGVTTGRSELNTGIEEVVTGDPEVAGQSFAAAATAADSAISASGHPAMRLASLLPFVGDNVEGVEAVARAERDSAAAGLRLVEAAQILGWKDILLPATTALGRVDIAKVREASASLDDVANRLRAALDALEASSGDGLLGPVATGYDDAVTALEGRSALAADVARLARLLPTFLGGEGPRRYLVAVQRLGETAPAGGDVGAVGMLSATDGTMSMGPLTPAPEPMRTATVSPRGPEAAAALLSGAAEAGLGRFDGVILTDSVGLQELLWMTGDAQPVGAKDPLVFEDAVVALEREPFLGPDRAAGETQQATLDAAVLQSALGRRPSTEAFAAAASGMVADRHLVLFSRTKREQVLIRGLGAAGIAELGRNPIAWTATSTASNLAGTFVRWTTTEVVTLETDGTARIKTTVELQDRAPTGPASALLGRAFGTDRIGSWTADLRLMLPKAADGVVGETSTPSETSLGKDDHGDAYLEAQLSADPGSAMSLIVSYRRPSASLVLEGIGTYRLRIVPQPLAYPGVVRLRIVVPDGTNVLEASEEFERGADVVRYEGTPTAPLDLFVRYG
ncbi:MAG: hypothetical protein ABI572_01800 [Actinomycetota bacterium]